MWFGVLGRLEVRRADGEPVRLSGPARRQLLAALLCRAGSAVSAATLIDDLWGAVPPRTAMTTLRAHVARLRDDLGREEGGQLLVTEGDGYRLTVGVDDVDASAFDRLVHESSATEDQARAICLIDEALTLWRDDAYLEFGDAPFAVGERVRLAELRALARERRTDLALSAGRAAELIGDLEQWIRTEPYRERSWEQLALALYRAGRQADALAACRRARRVLAEDLGVDPGPGLTTLEQRILRQDDDLIAVLPAPVRAPAIDRCPYLGLAGYDERDAGLFVGRERLTSLLAGRLSDQRTVVVTGASGVGKSSLVRAGLIPALRSGALPGSSAWRIEVHSPHEDVLAGDGEPPDLLVLDQAEELFTAMPALARDELADRLLSFIDDTDGRLVLIVRSDFYGRLAEIDALARFADKVGLLVGPLRADELRRTLTEPAAVAGLELEPELIETVMEDVAGQPEPLPLLSEAMVRTWHRRRGTMLTLEGYRLAGELAGALEAAAEECYAGLDEIARPAARHLLVRMASYTVNGWVRRPIERTDRGRSSAETAALAALVSARLVVVSEDRLEIAHDALLVHWNRMREWLAERSLAADVLLHLDQATAGWLEGGRAESDLYRGPRLAAAVDWRDEHPEDLSPDEHEFLAASAQAAETELAAAHAQAEREARGRRNLRRVAIGLAAMVVLAVAGGAVALHERGAARGAAHRAEQAALAADARQLAALSVNAPDIATSSLLAVAGYRLQDSPDTRGALLSAVDRNQSALWRMQLPSRPQRIAAAPDGSVLAISLNTGHLLLVDPQTRQRVADFVAADGWVSSFAPGGKELITYGPPVGPHPGARLAVYDLTGHRTHVISDDGDFDVGDPAVTTDGRWITMITTRTSRGARELDVFDATDWSRPPRQLRVHGHPIAVAAGRSTVAVLDANGSARVFALPSLRPYGRVPPAHSEPTDFAFVAISADGTRIARMDPAEQDHVAILTVDGSAPPTPLPVQPASIATMSFSPDGHELAIASDNGSLNVYRATDGAQLHTFAGHAGALHGVAWTGGATPSGMYTIGFDSQLISWDLGVGPRTVTQRGPTIRVPIRAERFGSLVLGDVQPDPANSSRRLFTFDPATGRYTSWSAGLSDDEVVNQFVGSFDGRLGLMSAGTFSGPDAGANRIEIFDLRSHDDLGRLALPAGTKPFADGLNAAISPDGKYAYSSLSRTRIGVFALPSGRYLRSYDIHFAQPDGDRIDVVPWQFDPAGRLTVFGYDPGARGGAPSPPDQRFAVVDPATGRVLGQARLGDHFPTALAWTPDNKLIAVGTYDGTLALYDAATARPVTDAGVAAAFPIQSLDFAPDGKTLISASAGVSFYSVPELTPEGSEIRVGDAQSTGGLWAWYGKDGDVRGLAGDLAHPSSGLLRWYELRAEPEQLISMACQLAGDDITHAQWRRYVGDRPYRHVCSTTR